MTITFARTRRRTLALLFAAVVFTAALPSFEAQAVQLSVTLPIADAVDMVLDEDHGHIYIAGGNSDLVLVTDLFGNVVRSIPADYPSGVALQPNGERIWVSEQFGQKIIAIDTETLDKVATVNVAPASPEDVAATDNRVIYGGAGSTLEWFDPATPAVRESLATSVNEAVEVSSANPDIVVTATFGSSPVRLAVHDLASKTTITETSSGTFLRDLALHPDGSEVVLAGRNPAQHVSYTVPALAASITYESTHSPYAAEWNSTGTHLAAAVQPDDPDIWIFRRGVGTAIAQIPVEFEVIPRGIALSADASTVWALTQDTYEFENPTIELIRRAAVTPGGVSGSISSADGYALDFGVADIFDYDTGIYIGSDEINGAGQFEFPNLDPGRYAVLGSNSDDTTFYGYFAEWYNDVPLYRFDQIDAVVVKSGATTAGVNFVLEPFFEDMFDTPFIVDIAWMGETGLTTGCGNGNYCPDDFVTRGQMAAFLSRALFLSYSDPSIEFTDDNTSVFEADIERLATAGITTGCGPGIFCPDDLVTRGQMAAFLVRAMGYTDRGTTDFTDDNTSVFEADIERLATAGVTTGCGPAIFCPEDYVTRGQMAAFLHRALGGGILYPGSEGSAQYPTARSHRALTN